MSVTKDATKQSSVLDKATESLRCWDIFGRGSINVVGTVHLRLDLTEILSEVCTQMQFIEKRGEISEKQS